MKLSLEAFEAAGGLLVANWNRAQDLEVSTGEHGFGSLSFFVQLTLSQSFEVYERAPGWHIVLSAGAHIVFEGRIEDASLSNSGVDITALGYWRALSDLPYSALWSDTTTEKWEETTPYLAVRKSFDKYATDKKNRLYLAPRAGESFGSSHGPDIGSFYYSSIGGSRELTVIDFDWSIDLPTDWRLRATTRTAPFVSANQFLEITSSGSPLSGAVSYTVAAKAIIEIYIYYNGSSTTLTGTTGDHFAEITNLRIGTSDDNKIVTSTTTTISAGSQVVTPVDMTSIYVGKRLVIDHTVATSESVEVTAITSTTFTAVFVNAYSGTTTIRAIVIYADEIIKDLVSVTSSANAGQLSSDEGLIQSPAVDLLNISYEDQYPADIIETLLMLGDSATPPRRWEAGVFENQILYFRPRGAAGNSWAVSVLELGSNSSLESLFNSAYAIYQDVAGRTLKTATINTTASQTKHGLIRRAAVDVSTTVEEMADIHAATVLADAENITPRGDINIKFLEENFAGVVSPKWLARAGDSVTIQTLPPTLGDTIDKIRTFIIGETTYNVIEDDLFVSPEEPANTLDQLIARQENK